MYLHLAGHVGMNLKPACVGPDRISGFDSSGTSGTSRDLHERVLLFCGVLAIGQFDVMYTQVD